MWCRHRECNKRRKHCQAVCLKVEQEEWDQELERLEACGCNFSGCSIDEIKKEFLSKLHRKLSAEALAGKLDA